MTRHKLRLAPHKTKAMILKGTKKREGVTFEGEGTQIAPGDSVIYLRFIIDKNRSFGRHIMETKLDKRWLA